MIFGSKKGYVTTIESNPVEKYQDHGIVGGWNYRGPIVLSPRKPIEILWRSDNHQITIRRKGMVQI
jgi:hypothetical protein